MYNSLTVGTKYLESVLLLYLKYLKYFFYLKKLLFTCSGSRANILTIIIMCEVCLRINNKIKLLSVSLCKSTVKRWAVFFFIFFFFLCFYFIFFSMSLWIFVFAFLFVIFSWIFSYFFFVFFSWIFFRFFLCFFLLMNFFYLI
jgi:hypothetical protein